MAKLTHSEANVLLTLEAKSVQLPYVVIGIVLLLVAVVFMLTRFPVEEQKMDVDGHSAGSFNLFRHKHLLMGIVAQFFYVGAQVCISSFFIRYCKYAAGLEELEAASYLGLLLLGFMVGRYVGTFVMQYVQPALLLALYSIINIILLSVIVFVGGKISIFALIGVEFFMSIMYPTIFSLAIKGLAENTKMASSYLVMAIVGGAIFPVIMGKVSDVTNIQIAYLVPAACFLIVLYFSVKVKSANEPSKAILSAT